MRLILSIIPVTLVGLLFIFANTWFEEESLHLYSFKSNHELERGSFAFKNPSKYMPSKIPCPIPSDEVKKWLNPIPKL
jgi:hypothetical protein